MRRMSGRGRMCLALGGYEVRRRAIIDSCLDEDQSKCGAKLVEERLPARRNAFVADDVVEGGCLVRLTAAEAPRSQFEDSMSQNYLGCPSFSQETAQLDGG